MSSNFEIKWRRYIVWFSLRRLHYLLYFLWLYGEFFVIPYNAFCLTPDSSYETRYHFDCGSYTFHSGCGRVDIWLSCWYCSVYNSVEGGQTFVSQKFRSNTIGFYFQIYIIYIMGIVVILFWLLFIYVYWSLVKRAEEDG